MQFVGNLLRRSVILLALVPAVLVVYVGGWLLTLVLIAIVIVALSEYYSGIYRTGMRPSAVAGFIGALLVVLATQIPDPALSWMLGLGAVAVAAGMSLLIQVVRGDVKGAVANSATTAFGVVWIGLMMSFALRLRGYDLAAMVHNNQPGLLGLIYQRMGAIVLAIAPVWCLDTTAFIVGNLFGHHKLSPIVSPGKTIEGAVVGFVGAVLMTILVGTFIGVPLYHLIGIGAMIGVVAQIGDLGKSALKRDIGIKDFGDIFGPHGGVIDRFDSVMFAMPAVYLYLIAAFGPYIGP